MPHTRMFALLLVAVFVAVPQARPVEQDRQAAATPQVTFRAGTNFVEVDAIITDAQGNFVRDLTRADFEVLEDGRPVSVETFSLIDMPIGPAGTGAADELVTTPEDDFFAEIVTNDRDFDGRIYLIVLDANQVAPLRTTHTKVLARQFVLENMSGSDQAAIVHIGADAISQDFTSNKRLLLDSIDRFVGQKLRSAVLNKFDDVTLKAGADGGLGDARDFEAVERATMARQTMQSVTNLANYMSGIRGRRKALVLLSEGLTSNMYDTIGPGMLGHDIYRDNDTTEAQYAADIALDMQNMIETATRANVVIYSVDPRGLTSEADDAIQLTGSTGAGGLAGGSGDAGDAGADSAAGSSAESVLRGLREELNRSHSQLRSVAEQTGGVAIVNTNSFDTGFDRIVKDNSTYYLLGYHIDPKYDGKFRNITVRVQRPGVEVRARKGYYALKTNPAASGAPVPDVLHELLASPMPMAGLTMRVVSDAFKGTAGNALVQMAVEVSGEDLALVERDGRFTNTLELSYIAFDPAGNASTRGSKTIDLSLQPQNRDALVEHGLRFATEIALAPGRYQIRLAAKEAVGGRAGSVFWDLDVPRFDAALEMSGVVLSSETVGAAPTVNDAATFKTLFPGVTSASRSFTLEDTVGVFAEIYDGRAGTPHDIDLSVAVLADDGFELFKETATRPSSDLSAERGSFAYVSRIPLEDLAPGVFILRVEAQSSLGGDPIVREVRFEIR